MQFFIGFVTATLIFTITLCLYIFCHEENKKRNRINILPGHEFYVHRIGEIKIKSIIDDKVTYGNMSGEMFALDIDQFLSLEMTPLVPRRRVKKPTKPKTHNYYTRKGKIYDVQAD